MSNDGGNSVVVALVMTVVMSYMTLAMMVAIESITLAMIVVMSIKMQWQHC